MGLSITVQKGHDFSSGNVTRAALNAGATPTIAITGSVGASEIAADSINDAQIKDDADILVAKLKLAHNNIVIGASDNNASVLAPNSSGLESTNDNVEGNVGFLCDDGTAFSVLRTDLNTAGGHVGIKKTGSNLKLIINTGIVDGNHLASSVFDNVTVERNNAAIRVKDGGISVAKFKSYKDSDDNVKAGFLYYGSGGTAKVLEATASGQVPVTGGSNNDFSLTAFDKLVDVATGASFPTSGGKWFRVEHGLGVPPSSVDVYLECITHHDDHGYAIGDRIYNPVDWGGDAQTGFAYTADSTYLMVHIEAIESMSIVKKCGDDGAGNTGSITDGDGDPVGNTHTGTGIGVFLLSSKKSDFKVVARVRG